jgi:Fe-S cluster assembly protein SufD
MAIATRGFTDESFAAFLESRDEPDWLRRRREEAWEQFTSLPMPDRAHEEWRRTDIRAFKLADFGTPTGRAAGADRSFPALLRNAELASAGCLSQANGHVIESQLDGDLAKRGVLFGRLDELVREYPDNVEPHLLTRAVDPAYDKFSALHAALWTGGTLLYVPRGVTIEQPLHSLVGLGEPGQSDFSHLLIVLEEGARATLLHEMVSVDGSPQDSGLHVGAVEVLLGQGADLRLVDLQNWGSGVWSFSHERALLARDARLRWTVAGLGSRLSKVNQEVVLEGQGADAEVNGVLFTDGAQHLSYHTRQHHQAPHTHSDLLYKGVLEDRSRIVWRGMIRVDPDAQKTDAYQRNDNLVLSRNARADSIPGLEIEADDVRCTHGATAGRVDDDQVFYSMCRGLSRDEAVHMIVEGFFRGVYDRIGIESVGEGLDRAVADKIGH